MIMSMTGFGSKEIEIPGLGKVRVEIRSTNHKFLETVLHLPEGFLSLEERIKKEIESRIKRGRVTCALHIIGDQPAKVYINRGLLKNYILAMRSVKNEFSIKNEVGMDTLIRLPGVLSLAQENIPKSKVWPRLKVLVAQAVFEFLTMRRKEGAALQGYLKSRVQALKGNADIIKNRFKKVVKEKLIQIQSEEERSSLLKDTDISEELERLTYHIKNFNTKLNRGGTIGKELDFIAQEMQRETNTIGAKCCDTVISAQMIQIKSQVEKIREQLQNLE
ncbi:MAG: YicC/YloC family endoribonuclease [Candidatus Omnitrophota bacterium]